MGFLDDVNDQARRAQGQEGGMASLQKMFSSSGGLQGMTTKLTNSGLGQQVQSWVGNGRQPAGHRCPGAGGHGPARI